MIISLIIFIVSIITIALLWYNKYREARGVLPLVYIGSHDFDKQLSNIKSICTRFIKKIDAEYLKSIFHDIAESTEKFGIIFAEKCINKFTHVRARINNKNIPKNRGSVSFFFKHIEDHQKSIRKSGKL